MQSQKEIDQGHLKFLAQYLLLAHQCLGIITTGKAATRLHSIAPILICVCSLFHGDIEIVVDEDSAGGFVKAHDNLDFMLECNNKAVCIVEAKKDDLEQGMAQDLVGCDVAAEVGKLDIFHGIVTNYVQWNFIPSLNDKVEIEERSLNLTLGVSEESSLKVIAEKIYSMLSDE